MSFADITVPVMSVTVIKYPERMGRWQPDARGRLEKAAMELYVERGFDETTVAEIAKRAGLTERTFFRHFADKREVLFAGAAMLQDLFVEAVGDAPADLPPVDAGHRRGRGRAARSYRNARTSPASATRSLRRTRSCRSASSSSWPPCRRHWPARCAGAACPTTPPVWRPRWRSPSSGWRSSVGSTDPVRLDLPQLDARVTRRAPYRDRRQRDGATGDVGARAGPSLRGRAAPGRRPAGSRCRRARPAASDSGKTRSMTTFSSPRPMSSRWRAIMACGRGDSRSSAPRK